jgi:hypothetical protein
MHERFFVLVTSRGGKSNNSLTSVKRSGTIVVGRGLDNWNNDIGSFWRGIDFTFIISARFCLVFAFYSPYSRQPILAQPILLFSSSFLNQFCSRITLPSFLVVESWIAPNNQPSSHWPERGYSRLQHFGVCFQSGYSLDILTCAFDDSFEGYCYNSWILVCCFWFLILDIFLNQDNSQSNENFFIAIISVLRYQLVTL